jgi:uncharacterized protein (TIGR01244 family)
MKTIFSILTAAALSVSIAAAQSKVTKENVEGIRNFAKLETTVACAGAITPQSVAEIKKMGFGSIINLREAGEPGANIDAEAAAAQAAGINYAHLPFNNAKPDPAVVDNFLDTIARKGYEPAFIHCASGNRAAAMWFIKRVVVDKWTTDRAMEEAAALGLGSQALKDFAMDYIQKKK